MDIGRSLSSEIAKLQSNNSASSEPGDGTGMTRVLRAISCQSLRESEDNTDDVYRFNTDHEHFKKADVRYSAGVDREPSRTGQEEASGRVPDLNRKISFSSVSNEASLPFHVFQKKRTDYPPIVLVQCGSFSPVTTGHVALFEAARDCLLEQKLEVVAGIMSPVHPNYGKKSIINLDPKHRVEMCKLSVGDNPWLGVSDWETLQSGWTCTLPVLRHYHDLINKWNLYNNKKVGIRLIMGADVLGSFLVPNLWAREDMNTLLGADGDGLIGIVVFERDDIDIPKILENFPQHDKTAVNIAKFACGTFNISSTVVREQLAAQKSVKYFLPDAVADYVYANKLYGCESRPYPYDPVVGVSGESKSEEK